MEELYKILLAEREHDSRRFWVIFGVMALLNGGLFAFVTAPSGVTAPLRPVAALLGLVLCTIWLLAERRMIGWLNDWEKRLIDIEPLYLAEKRRAHGTNQPPWPAGFQIFQERKRRNPVRFGLSTRTAACILPVLFFVAWGIRPFLVGKPRPLTRSRSGIW